MLEIPAHELGEEAFLVWVETMRQRFQCTLDAWSGKDLADSNDSENGVRITRKRPRMDFYIEWIYTVDLDNLVFWINNKPVFNLANIPRGDDFEKYIGE